MKVTDTIQDKVTTRQKRNAWQDFNFTLLGAIALYLLISIGESITVLQPLRIILGLLYVLFIPGYWLTTALFPRVDDLDLVERLGLSIGLSVASVPLLALILDWLQWGIFPWPILLIEFVMTALFTVVALCRRVLLPIETVYMPRIAWRPWWGSRSISHRRLYKMLIVGLLLVTAWIFLTPSSGQFVTEFYILGSDRLVADYPYEVRLHDEVKVNVGIMNRENGERNYCFEVWVTDSLHPVSRERVIRSNSFSLRPGEKYEQSVSWHMPWVGNDQKVELLLFSQGATVPSRQLRMWVNVQE